MRVDGVGRYDAGRDLDDAAGEAFDKSAKLLGLGYPGGPAISRLAEFGDPAAYQLPRLCCTPRTWISASRVEDRGADRGQATQRRATCEQDKANIARGFVDAIVDVLVAKCMTALKQTNLKRLVIAGGVGANAQLRAALNAAAAKRRYEVFYPELQVLHRQRRHDRLCRRHAPARGTRCGAQEYGFGVRPRWPLDELRPPPTGQTLRRRKLFITI
jgi:N6-L-threonylcarbamoyladenine synthase